MNTFRKPLALALAQSFAIATAMTGANTVAQTSSVASDRGGVSQDDVDTIETVLVSAAREPTPLASLGSAATLIDAETLKARQLAPLGEILRSVPGLAINRAGVVGAQTQMRLRGSESNHVLVFIDGVRANDPAQNDEFNITHALNYDIESVEVIRGPQSALWGSDAVAGVININTRTSQRGTSGNIFAEGGSNNWQNLGATAAYNDGRLNAKASVSSLDTDGENVSREGSERDGYDNLTSNITLEYHVSETLSLSGNLRYSDAETQFDGTDFSTGLLTDRDNTTAARQLYGRVGAQLDTLNGRWTHRLSYAVTATENRNRTENAFAVSGFDESESDADIRLATYQSSFQLRTGHRVTAALEHQEQDFRQRGAPSFFGDPNRDEDISIDSIVLEYSGQFSETLSALISARHDSNSDFDDTTTGRLSLAWWARGLDGGTKLRASYGTGVKNPTFTERFGFFTNFIGNPALKPETSQGWDIGIDQMFLDNALGLSATWFEADLQDEINGFVFDPLTGGFTAANEMGESNRRGAEFNASWQVATTLSVGLAYTWLDATEEDDFTGEDLREIRRPRHTASANLDWRFLGDRASLNINVDYNGAQDDFFFPPVPPFRERVELDSFTLVTAAGTYQLSPKIQLFARIENALDEEYEEIFGFRSLGRTAYAGVRYRFAN